MAFLNVLTFSCVLLSVFGTHRHEVQVNELRELRTAKLYDARARERATSFLHGSQPDAHQDVNQTRFVSVSHSNGSRDEQNIASVDIEKMIAANRMKKGARWSRGRKLEMGNVFKEMGEQMGELGELDPRDPRSRTIMATKLKYAIQGEEDQHLWPIPDKVLAVITFFVIFEYFVTWLRTWINTGWLSGHVDSPNDSVILNVDDSTARRQNAVDQDADLLGQFTVLTLNVYVNKAQENVMKQVEGLRKYAPDVICLQEVFHLDVLEAYRKAFPDYHFLCFGRGHTFSALFALMSVMITLATAFSGAIGLVEHLSDGRWRITWLVAGPLLLWMYTRIIRHHWMVAFLTGNRTGLALLVKRDTIDLDLKRSECNAFSRRGHAADILNLFRPRGFISAPGKIHLKDGRQLNVRFSTTHLNQPLEQALGDGRHRQMREIFDRCLNDNEFFCLGCDLNATPPGTINGSECITYSNAREELEDAWQEANPSDPKRDGLTWDQKENPLCVSLWNRMIWGNQHIRWRCDYLLWRYKYMTSASDNAAKDTAPSYIGRSVDGKAASQDEFNITVRSCDMLFQGKEAVSDHFAIQSVFDIKAKDLPMDAESNVIISARDQPAQPACAA